MNMTEKILFSIIGVLMLSISGIGVTAAAQHPAEVAQIIPEAIDVTEDAIVDTSHAVIDVVTGSGVETSVAREESAPQVSSREQEDEDEDEDGDDDDRRQTSADQSPRSAPTAASAPAKTPSGVKTFTMADVAAHASASSCYSAINGSVYDLSSFVSRHPGGSAAIKSLCGVDGTNAYMNQHGGRGRPASELASLKIGVIAQ